MVDFGYDISNFTAIDPIFGTVQDLVSLIDKAHAFGIRVVLDFIPNHSSDQHPWFIKSLQREEPFTDFYIWADPKGFDELGNPIPPSNWVIIFEARRAEEVKRFKSFLDFEVSWVNVDLQRRTATILFTPIFDSTTRFEL